MRTGNHKPERTPVPIVVFAQTPPPEHGQSRMVALGLEILRQHPESFEVSHVNARFSDSLDDIGESSLKKGLLIGQYLVQALVARFSHESPLLYYVPGPVKWSAVIRDWFILGILRMFYPKVVFHWHAIGQGEWAGGSERLSMEGPVWIDRIARRISRFILNRPFASFCVVDTSAKDAKALNSRRIDIIPNGLDDPCSDDAEEILADRMQHNAGLRASDNPCFRLLFLSHGTVEKGVIDAVRAIRILLGLAPPAWRFEVTFAGGIAEDARSSFEENLECLMTEGAGRIQLTRKGYVTAGEKSACYRNHDIFLASSHWESFGLTVLEAMAYQMQVVAAASDGVTGVLPEGHPYLAPPRSPEAFAEKILQCCTDILGGECIKSAQGLRDRFLARFRIRMFREDFLTACRALGPQSGETRVLHQSTGSAIRIQVYLADQNPGHDRSFGISRMSQVVLSALQAGGNVSIRTTASRTSQQAPSGITDTNVLPWGTRRKWVRLLTDHLHPLLANRRNLTDIHYYPKGYLPLISSLCRTSVVTIHDTIIQYDEDHYPQWRRKLEYGYWAMMLKHTLCNADCILTVSESSRRHILQFMERHGIPRKPIHVTYEPCAYENIPQPENPPKENHVIHLASVEPHKRTAHLIRWWHEAETLGDRLPQLHLIGSIPPEVQPLLTKSTHIVKRPFLEDHALQAAYQSARALILPSEIEGFGLPALEAYYLGTPVCFVKGTSVEEILGITTDKGGFDLESFDSLRAALDEVLAMSAGEIRSHGLKLRETYASDKVAEKMLDVFRTMKRRGRHQPADPP